MRRITWSIVLSVSLLAVLHLQSVATPTALYQVDRKVHDAGASGIAAAPYDEDIAAANKLGSTTLPSGSPLGSIPFLADSPQEYLGALCWSHQPWMSSFFSGRHMSDTQLNNASSIIDAAVRAALPDEAQVLGVQAALGESSLENLDHGDAAGPDSRGLFQQRDNGAWGSLSDRMDPSVSATHFFMALRNVDGWEQLPPSAAIHQVQRNQDPEHYTKFRQQALKIVDILKAQTTGGLNPHNRACGPARTQQTQVSLGALLQRPAAGTLMSPLANLKETSPFGHRSSPITGTAGEFHTGQDYAGSCGTPVHAADEGTVREVGWHPWGGGNRVEIDHGNGLVTTYNHLQGIAVSKGQKVDAAEIIATVGTTGSSTGCHLHFETILNGQHTDPHKWRLVPLWAKSSVGALTLTSYAPGSAAGQSTAPPIWSLPTVRTSQPVPPTAAASWQAPTATPGHTPGPTPAPSPEPTPTSAPTPEPTPTPTPEPSQTAEPEPTPTPAPEPSQTAAPEPEPAVLPEPTPTAEPEPTPTPPAGSTATAEPEPIPTA
ncbi:M23 family metallopeptidase [Pseudarthrobacter sp. NamE2]|uniref:M23 family metallopeptidase n=1 Tax=Pseudarthrobacter sp. NamE2 TaxID=2576838 RepID=UPI001485990F|nr:M23 family metallopeptidase [Pseudarthrobacter sp. NamE2]